jgi:hypothetical protein
MSKPIWTEDKKIYLKGSLFCLLFAAVVVAISAAIMYLLSNFSFLFYSVGFIGFLITALAIFGAYAFWVSYYTDENFNPTDLPSRFLIDCCLSYKYGLACHLTGPDHQKSAKNITTAPSEVAIQTRSFFQNG